MSSPITVRGQTTLWPTTGDTGYSNSALQTITNLAAAVVPIENMLNTTTGNQGSISLNNSNQLVFTYTGGPSTIISGGGTVTSVAAAGNNGITVSGSPITSSGTITLGLGNITPTSVSTSGNLTFSGSSQLITGDFTNLTRPVIQSNVTNGNTFLELAPNGTGFRTGVLVGNNSDRNNNAFAILGTNSLNTAHVLYGSTRGTGTALPLVLGVSNTINAMTIATNGNISTPYNFAASGTVTGSNLSGTNTGDQTITLTGDVTGSGTGSFVTTLANTAVTPASYTYANITVDSKGRITSASSGTAPVTAAAGSNTEIQFNNSGAFGASSNLTWDGTSQTISGNLVFAGNSRKITADMSSATQNNRLAIQTSVINGRTQLDFIPNGTATQSGARYFDNSDRANASLLFTGVSSAAGYNYIGSDKTGTGILRGLLLGVGSFIPFVIDIKGNIGLGSSFLTTSSTDGFPYISSVAGTPISIPTTDSGRAPITVDTTNNKLYFYSSGAWRDSTSGVGTVTSVGISSSGTVTVGGSPITTSGTLTVDLPTTGVSAASYTYSSITVDAYGRITAASSGTAPSSTPPAGSNTEIQFNNSGAFGASSNLTWDGTSLGVSGNITFSGNSRKILGDFSNATNTNRVYFQSSTTNGQTAVGAIPNGTSNTAAWVVENGSSATNCAGTSFSINSTAGQVLNYLRGSGIALPFQIVTNGSTIGLTQTVLGSVVVGPTATLSTSATDGFLYLSSSAGTPTGVPTTPVGSGGSMSGKTPVTVDTTNKREYFYNGSAWQNTNTPDYDIITATAAQTVFNTTNVRTVATAGGKAFLQVFVNGVKQVEGGSYAYTVTGANEITFNTGLVGGEAVEFYGFS